MAFNFFFYENARSFMTHADGTPPSGTVMLLCGSWAGAVSQTLTYPLDVIRRRMQVAGMTDSKLGYKDKSRSFAGLPTTHTTGGIDAIRNIIRKNGIKGLYFGLFPNLLKVAPSMGASFFTYELVSSLLARWE